MTSVNHVTPGQLTGTLATILSAGLVPMVWSAPGVGKSHIINNDLVNVYDQIAAAVAKGRGIKLHPGEAQVWERRAGDYDLLDYAGLPYVEDGIQRRASPDIWPGVGASGKVWGLLFLDEFTQAGREKQTVMQRLFDEGRVGDYVLPGHHKSDPNCERGLVLIVLAGNRQSDRANSQGMGTQTGSRVIHTVLEPSVSDWIDWANGNDVDPTVTALVRQCPEYLFKLDPSQKTEVPTGSTPRTLVFLSNLAKQCPPPELETQLYIGAVGEECARAYIALVHAARSINVEEALTNPEGADIPQEVGHQFAAASLLIRRANPDNFANVIRYVERVGEGGFASPEIAVFVVEAIKRRTPLVAETAAYRDFCLKWADIRS
tara:strand:+ start:24 stop:1148 length:1125 start_codon:yes stop_codon:yes gene_type:complete